MQYLQWSYNLLPTFSFVIATNASADAVREWIWYPLTLLPETGFLHILVNFKQWLVLATMKIECFYHVTVDSVWVSFLSTCSQAVINSRRLSRKKLTVYLIFVPCSTSILNNVLFHDLKATEVSIPPGGSKMLVLFVAGSRLIIS